MHIRGKHRALFIFIRTNHGTGIMTFHHIEPIRVSSSLTPEACKAWSPFAGVNLIKFRPYFSDRYLTSPSTLGLRRRESEGEHRFSCIANKYLDQARGCGVAPCWLRVPYVVDCDRCW